MRSLILSLALSMAVIHEAMAFTYWIDSTCTGDRSVDETVRETKYMAEAAHRRLNSASDTDFQHVYELAMRRKKDTSDPVFQAISGKKVFLDISSPRSDLLTQTRLIRLHEGCQRHDSRERPESGKYPYLLRRR